MASAAETRSRSLYGLAGPVPRVKAAIRVFPAVFIEASSLRGIITVTLQCSKAISGNAVMCRAQDDKAMR